MTNEEVIETLKVAKSEIEWEYPMDYQIALDKAIDKAIEALEQIDKIKEIIAIDNMVIQEDVLKYKMICEVLK